MLSKLIQDLNSEYIAEARNSPNLLEDMAAMEKYMAESYSGRIFVELLQNADDCESSKILLEEYEGNIIFANNGRPFDANDIISISRSGASRKERGSKIGYRGVGFKSTAYLTSEIIIYSSNTYFTFSKSKCAKVLNKPSDKLPTIRIPFLVDDIELHLKNHINDLVAQGYTTIFIFLNAKLEQFKEEIKNILEEIDNDTVILYLDEAIVTDEPTTTGKWALKGEQPVIPTNSKGSRKRRVIYGAVNPKTGEVFYSTKRSGNTENFKSFLK